MVDLPKVSGADLAKVCAYAQAQVGLPYVWGGNGPDYKPPSKGFDCSGLTMMAYRQIGINIPRTATLQSNFGKPVTNLAVIAPGDLIFPPFNPRPHVFMYVGNGKCVEAPRTGLNVRIIDLPSNKAIWRVRRIALIPSGDKVPNTDFEMNPIYSERKEVVDAIKGIPGVDTVEEAVKAIGKAVGFFTEQHNWYRAGLFVLGSGLIIVGVRSAAT